MPIYVYRCLEHGTHEKFESMDSNDKHSFCPECGCACFRDYAAEKAGAIPFRSYWTDALTPGKTVQINSKRQEQEHCRRLGVERVS